MVCTEVTSANEVVRIASSVGNSCSLDSVVAVTEISSTSKVVITVSSTASVAVAADGISRMDEDSVSVGVKLIVSLAGVGDTNVMLIFTVPEDVSSML